MLVHVSSMALLLLLVCIVGACLKCASSLLVKPVYYVNEPDHSMMTVALPDVQPDPQTCFLTRISICAVLCIFKDTAWKRAVVLEAFCDIFGFKRVPCACLATVVLL